MSPGLVDVLARLKIQGQLKPVNGLELVWNEAIKYAANKFRQAKPVDSRGCSEPECCGESGPDFEYAWDSAIEDLLNEENNA